MGGDFVKLGKERIIALTLATVSLVLSALFVSNFTESVAAAVTHENRLTFTEPENASVLTFTEVEPKTESEAKTNKEEGVSEKKTEVKGKKLGKISEQFISPYTANTHEGKIYLNNGTGIKISPKKLADSVKDYERTDSVQVLILHTHATENYTLSTDGYFRKSDLSRTKSENNNVIGVGNEVEKCLKRAGIGVIHDKTLHDSPAYTGSYTRSAATLDTYLKKYKGLKLVLDIHRDSIGSDKNQVKPVAKIKGKKAAQVMICVGSNTGEVDYFPHWKKNLAVGLKLQRIIETKYPGLARGLFLGYERCYNQNMHQGAVIIEFGTNANSFDEAKYSATLVGECIKTMFKSG